MLTLEVADLQAADLDLTSTGFTDKQLSNLLAQSRARKAGKADEDEAAEVEDSKVRPGDLWQCGVHRLLCGDATELEHVRRLLNQAKPHLMVTDPPYGVSYNANWRQEAPDGPRFESSAGRRSVSQVPNDHNADWSKVWSHFRGEVIYVWCASLKLVEVAQSLPAEFKIRSLIIGRKVNAVISRGHYHWQHETCWYAVRDGGKSHWAGSRKETTVWDIKPRNTGKRDDQSTDHSTQKPVECMRRPIENNSAAGDGVYDPFLGSGTTMIACEQTGRICYGLEIEPAYVAMAVERWQAFTGEVARLDGDGRTYAEVMADRKAAAA